MEDKILEVAIVERNSWDNFGESKLMFQENTNQKSENHSSSSFGWKKGKCITVERSILDKIYKLYCEKEIWKGDICWNKEPSSTRVLMCQELSKST